jgi:hypothetical protein
MQAIGLFRELIDLDYPLVAGLLAAAMILVTIYLLRPRRR